jgi:DNA topoisomerase IB
METLTETKEKPSVRFAKMLMESKRQTEKEARWAYKNDPKVKETIAILKRRNAERGTPIV